MIQIAVYGENILFLAEILGFLRDGHGGIVVDIHEAKGRVQHAPPIFTFALAENDFVCLIFPRREGDLAICFGGENTCP